MHPGIISFIGVGANLGRPLEQCREAIQRVGQQEGITLLREASFYRTEPIGDPGQPWYVNTVIEVRTTLTPRSLLSGMEEIEQQMGRRRSEVKWEPRVIDLDLLFYGQEVIAEEGLIIPHPELQWRRFVLIPLNEIASYVVHPSFGVSVRGLLKRCEDRSRVEKDISPEG